jgi:PAS domain S-box-containing protein
LGSVIENIPHTIFIKDAAELRYVRVNRAAEQLFGYGRDDLVGKNDYDFFPADQADFFTGKDREVLAGSCALDIAEETVLTKDGEQRTLHTKKIPLFGQDGEPRYLLGISEDITERCAAQVALARAKEEAERANLAKSEFLSRMSHELRTPLNAILGFAQLLEADVVSDDERESVEQILRGGRHLLALVNEVLELSRIESGNLGLSPEPVEVGEILDEIVALVRSLAAARRIDVAVATPELGPVFVRADRQRLKQVLLNLASNAVKYNREDGTVRFSCGRAEGGRVRIGVSDNGPGLAPDQVERAFVPFERLGAEATGVEGTGIGLTLSRRLAEGMGGTLYVCSTPGQGATFTVELPGASGPLGDGPRSTVAEGGAGASPAAQGPGGVLYIEDNAPNVRLVERILARRPGVRLVTSALGAPAVALARQHRPDLVLLDLHLADVPGDEVLRRLRADPATADVAVVMLSADATAGQADRLLGAGAQGYLTKPVDVAKLLELVDRALAPKAP